MCNFVLHPMEYYTDRASTKTCISVCACFRQEVSINRARKILKEVQRFPINMEQEI